ncbi:hypothetical protein JK182_07725 [Acetobacter okinawensis]|uniref:hypothetical protein n=1 Tax=Acetobacter okinawensis TaxID=1076594 RepID=UPI001BAC4772|nr:hypothetical protein [Acetobacter okinawensis]MBS0988553.1 hypothetical protein [Acetobacter okinawensis]
MYLFLAPHRAFLAEFSNHLGLKHSMQDHHILCFDNSVDAQSATEQTLQQFARLVCQQSVNRTRKSCLHLDISFNTSVATIVPIASYVRTALATMLINTIEYSFYERSSGVISIHLSDLPQQQLRISVADNGWGPDAVGGTHTAHLKNLDTLGDLTVAAAYPDGTGMMTTLTVDTNRLQEKSATASSVKSDMLPRQTHTERFYPDTTDTISKIESLTLNVL